jgi:hypothetical protein
MPSSWLIRRETASGPRYRVLFRVGGVNRRSATVAASRRRRKRSSAAVGSMAS